MDERAAGFLVVLDGSVTSERALDVALAHAEKSSAPLTLLAIIPPRLWRAKQGQFQVPPDSHDEDFARSLIADARQRCAERGVKAIERLRSGAPAHVILEEAAKGYELVILGERR